jgi:hypothetical protein
MAQSDLDIAYQRILDKSATSEQVASLLSTTSDPVALTNYIRAIVRYRGDAAIADVVRNVWLSEKGTYKGSNWEVISSQRVLVALAGTLGQLDDAYKVTTIDYVRDALRSADEQVRAEAAISLASLGDDGDVASLESLVRGDNLMVASQAAIGLKMMGSATALSALQRLAQDPSIPSEVRSVAQQLLDGANERP